MKNDVVQENSMKRLRQTLIALIVSAAVILPAGAVESGDHDRARRALEAGEILPLKTVLETIARESPGQVMEVELERRGERWIYEIKLLRPGGSLVKLKVDARDASLIAPREHRPKNDY